MRNPRPLIQPFLHLPGARTTSDPNLNFPRARAPAAVTPGPPPLAPTAAPAPVVVSSVPPVVPLSCRYEVVKDDDARLFAVMKSKGNLAADSAPPEPVDVETLVVRLFGRRLLQSPGPLITTDHASADRLRADRVRVLDRVGTILASYVAHRIPFG